jgi:hypothetical protein
VGVLVPATPAQAYTSVSISFFHSSLAPYGDWVDVSSYGRCWRPRHVAVGWQPYLYGEWMYTDAGWTWNASDPWGGDPYHYGTWVYSARYGWVWIPGTVWAPAWVTWRITDDYCGWAPVPPSFAVGTTGYVGPAVSVSSSAYVFVPANRFAGVRVNSVRVPPAQNATFVARSRPMTRFEVRGGVLSNGGPAVAQVERASGRRVARVSVAQARTQAVPVAASVHGTRSPIIVPASERAKALAPAVVPSGRHATQNVNRTQPSNIKPERAVHESPRPQPQQHTVMPPPVQHSQPKHERSVQAAPPPPVRQKPEVSGTQARLAPPHVERGAAAAGPPPHVQKQPDVHPKPQGPPPQAHGNPPGREKDKEHGPN